MHIVMLIAHNFSLGFSPELYFKLLLNNSLFHAYRFKYIFSLKIWIVVLFISNDNSCKKYLFKLLFFSFNYFKTNFKHIDQEIIRIKILELTYQYAINFYLFSENINLEVLSWKVIFMFSILKNISHFHSVCKSNE